MKKFCNKITNQQWRVTVPNINFRKSLTHLGSDDKMNRISSGSYDVQAAQEEFDSKGTVSAETVCLSSDSEEHYEDANEDSEIYTEVIKVSKNLTETNNKYEYDVPRICFSFFEGKRIENQDYDMVKCESIKHKSEVKIVLTPPIPSSSEESLTIKKSDSDPNLSHYEDDVDDGFYKVPKKIKENRLSKSLHDFKCEELSKSHESIEHISCSQVINTSQNSLGSDSSKPKIKRGSLLNLHKSRAVDTWSNFKTKFNKIIEEHSTHQKVGSFPDKERIALNIEEMYKNSRDKCKKMLKSTGKMFKAKREQDNEQVSENSSQIIKNDAFFAKVELKASDIEYVFEQMPEKDKRPEHKFSEVKIEPSENDGKLTKLGFRKSKQYLEGQNGFEDLRRYIKQGGDFCKELSYILQERSEAEIQYSKSLSKLSGKLSRICREGVGGLNEAWKSVALELETRAEAHWQIGNSLLEEAAKPLRNLTENQHKSRKNGETVVDKAAKTLADWRAAEAKSKKHSHACARDNEKLQDVMIENRLSRSTSVIQLPNINKHNTDKDNAKLEGKKRKAEEAVKKADIEYYSHCVGSERARLEWESAVSRGSITFQALEEERLNNLKSILSCYLNHSTALTPKLTDITNKIRGPIESAEASKDLSTFLSLRQSSQQTAEQLLPDFYCEHITLAMNRERRKQALIKLLQSIQSDIERETKSKDGLENLSKAIRHQPNFGSEDSQQTVNEKLYHMKSMLQYLEGAKYKVHNALAELDCKPRDVHPLAAHITVTRDKAGLQQSILKVPQYLREQWITVDKSQVSEKRDDLDSDTESNWIDRGTADGNSNQPDSDFDEFSSQGSSICEGICNTEETPVQPIAQCKALYSYTPNLADELAIRPGDMVSVYRKQEDGWWLGECNGSVGIFPATYVEAMK